MYAVRRQVLKRRTREKHGQQASYSVTIYNAITRLGTGSELISINANLTIEINVNDYEQVIRNGKSRLLGTMTKVPGASSFLKGKVDETIEEEVKKNLEQTLPSKLADELTKGLQEEGVQASVSVSLAYQ
jgi:hypothetical protein